MLSGLPGIASALPRSGSDRLSASIDAARYPAAVFGHFVSFLKAAGCGRDLYADVPFFGSPPLKLINLFLLTRRRPAGWATTGEVGLVYGTIGIIGLTLGGIIGGGGGVRGGLEKMDMADDVQYVADLRHVRLPSFLANVEPAGDQRLRFYRTVRLRVRLYGLYALPDVTMPTGPQKTAHYAICTGFMALGMMIPGMFAGWLQEQFGYNHFSYGSCCAASCRSLRCRC